MRRGDKSLRNGKHSLIWPIEEEENFNATMHGSNKSAQLLENSGSSQVNDMANLRFSIAPQLTAEAGS